MGDLDIEETNKIRVALGMKPLPGPGNKESTGPIFKETREDGSSSESDDNATYEGRQSKAAANWQKLEDEKQAAARRKTQKDAIRKARDAAQRAVKLEGKGLGEADDDTSLDTKAWLKQQSKRQKQIEKARKLAEELEERERLQQREYTSADLAGVKVGHEIDRFDEGDERVLVLKDTNVDAEDVDDELENVELRDKEGLEERLNAKLKKPAYDPSEEVQGGGSLLGQYDEEIYGKQKSRFTLGELGNSADPASAASGMAKAMKGNSISLDILKDEAPVSDYVDPSEIKMRKPKKKKAKISKKRTRDDDEDIFPIAANAGENNAAVTDAMAVDNVANGTTNKKSKSEAFDFVDDEDLQANLALQRRQALKKREKMKTEDIIKQLKDGNEAEDAAQANDEPDAEPGLVIDETSEFVDRLQRSNVALNDRIKEEEDEMDVEDQPVREADDTQDVDMNASGANIDGEIKHNVKVEDTDENGDVEAVDFSEEAAVSKGVGQALALLTQRGLIDRGSEEEDLNKGFRERQRFLAEKHKREDEAERKARTQREKDRQSGRFEHMSARDREEYARRVNVQREQGESRELAELFNREYKPNFRLTYSDEFGREVDRVEAFKNLSHQFHGKGSGKQKTEKRLKKISDEKRRMAESSLDSSQRLGMNNVAGATARKNRQAGVRLQ